MISPAGFSVSSVKPSSRISRSTGERSRLLQPHGDIHRANSWKATPVAPAARNAKLKILVFKGAVSVLLFEPCLDFRVGL